VADTITTIALITCNRLPGLVRSLESYIANMMKHRREVDYAVFDDTKDAAGREATRAELKRLKEKHGVSIRYAGFEEKRSYARLLEKESGIDPTIIEFALFDPFGLKNTVGANRNASLLDTVDEMFYSADDDTICEFFSITNQRPDIAITSLPNPTEIRVFPDKTTADFAAIRTERNVLSLVEEMLGRTAQACIDETRLPADMRLMKPELAAKFDKKGTIRLNWLGIFGDSGYRQPTFLLWLQGESRKDLLRDEQRYLKAKQSRRIFRAPLKRTLGPGHFCQTTALGFDNRDLLPPFLPALRGEDFTFGKLLRICWKDVHFGYTPLAIRHEPLEMRHNEADDLLLPASYQTFVMQLVEVLATYHPDSSLSDAERLKGCGMFLQGLGGLESVKFKTMLRKLSDERVARSRAELKLLLEGYKGFPGFWAADVREYQARMDAAVGFDEYLEPKDLRDFGEPLKLCQNLFEALGRLIVAWPLLVQTAATLKSRGTRLTQTIH
jgi:hypothetical protein